jgi:glutamyl-tRNA(Gln) amidotransferase subunit E
MYDFQYKPFEEMTDADYEHVGFMSGLEVHQQLLTEKKLFCRCPAGQYSNEYHAEILRHMRPTLSELGEYDPTALMEFKTKKDIIYRIHKETVCTYEMDDTPPFMLNEEAFEIALEISMLCGLSLVDELHIARKQYLDGSIPTGFQRTTILGIDGAVPYKDREIGIVQLGLEEDSCREVSDVGHRRTYITDRLGTPLCEIVTLPQMRTPTEVAEVAQILRKLMRSTGRVRRGTGSTRADTNVSVTGGTRIEIKGVPSIRRMPLLTYNESRRQWNLLRLREQLHLRGITKDTFHYDAKDITRVLRRTQFPSIAGALQSGQVVYGVCLREWAQLLRWGTQEGTYFTREISDRVRVIACLSHLPNIIHSDTSSESISGAEWNEIKKALHATAHDSVVVVWGDPRDVDTAVKEIAIRAREATIGIPSETRQALPDGTTGFERILPGPQRMYPDTDLPPKKVTEERIAKITARLPVVYWERKKRLAALGVPQDCIEGLAISPFIGLFDYAIETLNFPPVLAAVALYQYPRRLNREGWPYEKFNQEELRTILTAVAHGELTRDGILQAMRQSLKGEFSLENLSFSFTKSDLRPVIEHARRHITDIGLLDWKNLPKLTLDRVMDEVRGAVLGAHVADAVNEFYAEEKNS